MHDRGRWFGKASSRHLRPATFACSLTLALVVNPRDASAANDCDGVQLDLSDDLSPTWQEAGRRLRSELVASNAPCVTAKLSVDPAPGGVKLSATSADGHTTRMLTRPASLIPTALGIVASLPPDAQRAPHQPTAAQRVAREDSAPVEFVAPSLQTDPTPQLWIGAGVGARLGGLTWLGAMDIEGRLGFESRQWLVVGSFRYATSLGEAGVSTDDSYYELVGSLGVGRRFSLGPSSLDIVLSPEIASASLNDNDDEDDPVVGPRTEFRVGTSLCWWTQFNDGSRINLTADTDVMPYGLFHSLRTSESEPPMPVWTLGLRLGAAGRIF